MLDELGLSGGTAILLLITSCFMMKWVVKNGMKEVYNGIKERE